jgi:hypothetical protein
VHRSIRNEQAISIGAIEAGARALEALFGFLIRFSTSFLPQRAEEASFKPPRD